MNLRFPGKNLSKLNLARAVSPNALGRYHWTPSPASTIANSPKYAMTTLTTALPTSVDLRTYCPPIDDQESLGSCTGNAVAGAIDVVNRQSNFTVTTTSTTAGTFVTTNTSKMYVGMTVEFTSAANTLRLGNQPIQLNTPYYVTSMTANSRFKLSSVQNPDTLAMGSTLLATGIGSATIQEYIRVSRLFIYYQERVLENDVYYDAGAYLSDGLRSVSTYGAPTETLWPYIQSRWATRPSGTAYSDALNRKVTGYGSCANFTTIKAALAAGHPVVIGFTVYASFEGNQNNNTGIMPYPNTRTEQILGGHAVCVVGYNDNFPGTGDGRFICRNSWGTSWGDQGYFYMPYQVVQNTNMSGDFWAISAVHNP